MCRKLYMKLGVQEILTHTKSRSYLFFFSSIISISISISVGEFGRETLKVIYLGSRRGDYFCQLYAYLITPGRKLNTDMKLLYPKKADKMNTDILLQLRGPLHSLGEQQKS